MTQTVSIIVPLYNEEEGIPQLKEKLDPFIKRLQEKFEVQLVLVDDGSIDKTNELLHQFYDDKPYALIIKHPKNKNLGGAIRTGVSHCHGDIIAMIDSDCTYQPSVIEGMINMLDDNTDIVTASPLHPKGKVNGVPGYRIFLSKSVSTMYRILLRSGLHTHTAMVRVYKKKVFDTVTFKADNFLSVTEIVAKALLQGYKVKEFPCEISVRKYGMSKMKFVNVTKSHLNFMRKIVMHKLFRSEI
ncbi:glycosyl transferase [Candidatus Woesearchaeota archaeon CG10_big_fil_rev_8_21_14_0_10_45_16]|nr:MAG: glycosyl transferase [Candidatus Woesearchaeota archaeon CG10_big_fil_rev_8_21_14_0_10_45_16]